MGSPLLSIIIINYNGEFIIRDCLDAIFENNIKFPFEVIVVDNKSQDNSIPILQSYLPKIQLILNTENTGFIAANNQAVKVSKGDLLLLLNNDTKVLPNSIHTMVEYMQNHPQTGALSPRLIDKTGNTQIQGGFLGSWAFRSSKTQVVSFICGASMMTRRTLYDAVGGLDQNLFFYNDDVDYCRSLRKSGYDIVYLPQAEVIHYGGISTTFRKGAARLDGYRGSLYMTRKYYSEFGYYIARVLIFLEVLPKLIYYFLFQRLSNTHLEYYQAHLKITHMIITGKTVPKPQ